MVTTAADLADALALLDRAEAAAGVPLVDEAERRRLEAIVDGADTGEHHHALLAHRDGTCLGYAGVVLPDGPTHAVGDVALDHGVRRSTDVLRALLQAVDTLAARHEAHGTQMWIRHATPDDVLAAVAAGYAVHRRLAVLGRRLVELPPAPDAGDDVVVRPATEDDVDDVVAVLRAAYAGSLDEGWDRARFDGVASAAWFRLEDVLVAASGDEVLGVHWTKRRDATTGEVYNLAVAPRGQGQQLGRRLLDAGLRHLADLGLQDVVLWVDLANEAAVRLYVTAGFDSRWEDVALERHGKGVGRHAHRLGAYALRHAN